jgi:hypothetical protein
VALAPIGFGEDLQVMVTDQSDDFHVRPGGVRSGGTRINSRGNVRSQPFLKQVQVAVRRAGGDPNRIGREGAGREGRVSGRFNARGRCAKVVPLFLREGHDGGWQHDSSGRFRSRRVAVKARIIKLNPQGRKQGRMVLQGPSRWAGRSMAIFATLSGMESIATGSGERPTRRWRTRLQECRIRSASAAKTSRSS